NVDHVLEGSVRKVGNRLRITAQFVSIADGFQLWSEQYDRELVDVFAIQEDIARALVSKLKIQLGREADRALVRPPTEDLEAYQLYLRGRYYWERRYPGFFQHALQCFESAIARDASYALAYAGLADVYSSLGNLGAMPPGVAFGKAKSAAQRAVVLDDEL